MIIRRFEKGPIDIVLLVQRDWFAYADLFSVKIAWTPSAMVVSSGFEDNLSVMQKPPKLDFSSVVIDSQYNESNHGYKEHNCVEEHG